MAKRAILFVNGDLADVSRLRFKKSDFLIGVDGGSQLIIKLGLKPNLIIGDFDSFPRPPEQTLFKASQDLTDTEFAVNYCRKRGFKEIVLVGILGTRLDHLMANIFLAGKFNLTIIESRQTLYFVTSGRVLEGRPGDVISLVPLSDCAGVITSGLKWPLQGEYLKVGSSRGISNVMTGKTCRISLKKGRLLLVYNRDDASVA